MLVKAQNIAETTSDVLFWYFGKCFSTHIGLSNLSIY